MPITAPPQPPLPIDDQATFDSKSEAWLQWQHDSAAEFNALEANVEAKEASAVAAAGTATTKAGEAGASALAASDSASAAALSEGAASDSALAASDSASAAAASEGAASDSSLAASASESAASASEGKAQQWAESATEVEPGKYSAKYWAGQAVLAAGVIDDTQTSTATTWSSQKIDADKQATLVSGTNIKTINGESVLGAGNISAQSVYLDGDPAPYVTQTKQYVITNYSSFSSYVVQVSAGSVSLSGDTITFTAPGSAGTVTLTVTMDDVPQVFGITVQPAGVATPTNVSPTNGATDQNGSVTLTGSAFAWCGLEDAHLNSDWQLATDSAFATIMQSTSTDAGNKTSWTVSGLSTSQTYYWRVRYRGANNGVSDWSAATSFVTKATFGGLIGTPGGQGFGVGECPDADWLTTLNLAAMVGTTDKAHANYGNYQHTNSGISVFIPKFYYRWGDAADPAYATYGANTLTIKGIETFSGEAAANIAGYALHRAFVNNGVEVPGFFVDKFLASQDGAGSCKSVQNGVPISLTTTTTYTRSQGMTGCTGILADAVVLARARGAGWNGELIFQRDALAKTSLAHAQHATSATYCAWYDASGTTNFPKGCNTTLKDTNDATVTFTTAGDSGDANKPKTGSASALAKTTHNGQACGVADVNGAMYQVLLGLTQAGANATDTATNTTGDAYVLKRSARHADLTGGWGGATDAWGTAASLAGLFDLIAGFLPWGATTGWDYFGNGGNQVFSGATSGTDYLRSCCGIALTTGMSAAGTSQFGNDGNYRYTRANLFPCASGHCSNAAVAGVFYRHWGRDRSGGDGGASFRCAAYGN